MACKKNLFSPCDELPKFVHQSIHEDEPENDNVEQLQIELIHNTNQRRLTENHSSGSNSVSYKVS
jgi:hypothetical protein